MFKVLRTFGRYIMLLGRIFSRPESMRMYLKQLVKEVEQLGVNSAGIVLLISFFTGAVFTGSVLKNQSLCLNPVFWWRQANFLKTFHRKRASPNESRK